MPIIFNFLSAFSLLIIPALSWTHPSLEKESVEVEQPQTFSYITPPKGWEIADPKFLAKSVQIAFLKKSNSGFCPSVNLAVEKSNLSLPEYLNVIRQIHESDKRNRWRQLGKVHTLSGIGQLTEIDTATEFGPVRMLQLILVKQEHIYVVTAAALKEEIAQYYKDFQSTFRSLQVTTDLVSTVPQMERRDSLKVRSEQLIASWQQTLQQGSTSLLEPRFQKEHWIPFQSTLLQDFEDMGAHWQILMLKNIQEKMVALIPQIEAYPEVLFQEENSIIAESTEPDFLFEEELLVEAAAQITDADENVLELSPNEESLLGNTIPFQETDSVLENTADLPLALLAHSEIADNSEPALVSEEEDFVEPMTHITDAEENSLSENELAHCNESFADEEVLAQEKPPSLNSQIPFSVDPICHADETFPNNSLSPSSIHLENVIEDRQNTP